MFVVIAYDISDDKRRTRVAKELENWGQRIQYSLFECELDPERIDALVETLRQLVKDEDRLRVYQMCQSCLEKAVAIGGKDFAVDQDFYQV